MKSLSRVFSLSKVICLTLMLCFMFSMTALASTKESNVIDILMMGHGKLSVGTRDMHFIKGDMLNGVAMDGMDFTMGLYLNDKGKSVFKEKYKLENDPTLVVFFVNSRIDTDKKALYCKVYKERIYRSENKDDWFEVNFEKEYQDVSNDKTWLTITNKVFEIAIDLKKKGLWID